MPIYFTSYDNNHHCNKISLLNNAYTKNSYCKISNIKNYPKNKFEETISMNILSIESEVNLILFNGFKLF